MLPERGSKTIPPVVPAIARSLVEVPSRKPFVLLNDAPFKFKLPPAPIFKVPFVKLRVPKILLVRPAILTPAVLFILIF